MLNNLYSNKGHNKLGGHISKNVAKIATNWLKISRASTFGQSLGGHNLAIFYPILTLDHTKMISSLRRVQKLHLIPFRFYFFSHFLPPVATWARGPKSTPRLSVLALPITTNSLLKIDVP